VKQRQAPSCICIGRNLQGQFASIRGDSLQEQCTRREVKKMRTFCSCFTNSNQLNFKQHSTETKCLYYHSANSHRIVLLHHFLGKHRHQVDNGRLFRVVSLQKFSSKILLNRFHAAVITSVWRILACVAGGSTSECARETFCGEAANSLAGFGREGIFAGIQLDSSPFFSRPERLFALAFGTKVRAGTHSRRLRRLGEFECLR